MDGLIRDSGMMRKFLTASAMANDTPVICRPGTVFTLL
jgi:hypothetical protein